MADTSPALRPRAALRPTAGVGLLRRLRAGDGLARLALASFLWGMLLAPALHLVNHRDDHHHGPGGLVHDHGDGRAHRHGPTDDEGGDHPPAGLSFDADSRQERSPATPPGPHGAGDPLHFGMAWLDGAGPALSFASHPAPDLPLPSPPGIGRLRRERGSVLARGPPAPASSIDSIRG